MFAKQLFLPAVILVASLLFAAWWVFDYQASKAPEPLITSERVGYILTVENQEREYEIQFDEVALLTGEPAIAAALRTGACTEETRDDCAPNDYFIDDNTALATSLKLDRKPTVLLVQDGTSTLIESSLPTILELFAQDSYDWREQLFRITLTEDRTVIKVEEIYLP